MMHLFNKNNSFVGEIGNILYIIISILACRMISKEEFDKKYNRVLFLFAILSIVFYMIPLFYADFPKKFDVIQDYAGSKFYNAWLYCYPVNITKSYYRNQSVFWEAGAYQAFLNIALFLEIYIVNRKPKKKYIICYIIAILLTKSTTGYMLLFLTCSSKVINFQKITKKTILNITIGIVAVCLFFSKGYGNIIFDKFSSDNEQYASYTRRSADSEVDLKITLRNFRTVLFGLGENKYIIDFTEALNKEINSKYLIASSSNSITAYFAKFGIIGTLPIVVLYFEGIKSLRSRKERLVSSIIILLCIITENFIISPIFLTMAIRFYRQQELNKEEKRESEINELCQNRYQII